MLRTRLGPLAALAVAIAASACRPPPPPALQPTPRAPAPPAPPAKPSQPLAIAIVIDQLAAWVLSERLPALPDGGLTRLRHEGVWVHDMAYLHATTETAPGHAALFTGRPPRENGIIDNNVWRSDLDAEASELDDAHSVLVASDGPTSDRGVSLGALKVPTIADALLERDPRAIVVALSLKDRGAVFAGGRKPTASLWYDASADRLVTSSAFASSLPGWAAPFAHPAARTLHPSGSADSPAIWDLLDRSFVAAHATTPDDQPGEASVLGPPTFPHTLPAPPAEGNAFRSTPMADAFLVDLALAAVDGAHDPDHAMLLSVSLSSNDVIGHAFGPDSWEAWDELLRLNASLGRLFAGLDARVGPNGYSVVLTGDHGVVPLPQLGERGDLPWCQAGAKNPYEKPCSRGLNVPPQSIREAIDQATQRFHKRSQSLVRVIGNLIWLTDDARALSVPDEVRVKAAILSAVSKIPGIRQVYAISDLAGACPPPTDESPTSLVCHSVIPGQADYYVVIERGNLLSSATTGTGHGSLYRYDRTVPLLIRLANRAPASVGTELDRALFGSFYATLWYALTRDTDAGLYGGPIGVPASQSR